MRVLLTRFTAMSDDPDGRLKSLDDLGVRLQEGRQKAGLEKAPVRPTQTRAAGKALNASIEFVVSTLIGAGLGYTIGAWANAREVGLILGLIVGFAAGVRALMKTTMEQAPGEDKERDGNGRDID